MNIHKSFILAASTSVLVGCGASNLVSTPVANIDAVPLKVDELSESEKQRWGHADLLADTIPGMSVDKAYKDIIGNKKGKTVIVAVVDSGIDLNTKTLMMCSGPIRTSAQEMEKMMTIMAISTIFTDTIF